MSHVLTASLLLVASVLLVAGVSKLVAPSKAQQSFAAVLSAREGALLRGATFLFATAEIVTGVALSILTTLAWSGIVAILLGCAFIGVGLLGVTRIKSGDRHLPCGCFGAVSSTPIGFRSVVAGAIVAGVCGASSLLSNLSRDRTCRPNPT